MVAGSDCPTGKEQLTKAGAREKRDRLRAGGGSQYVYRCPFCGTYHVANRRTAEQRRRRAAQRGFR